MKTLSFLGLADIYLQPYGQINQARPVGSVSQCQLAIESETINQRNYGRAGGLANSVSRVQNIGLNLTLQSVSPENLALALRGTASSVVSGTVTDEQHTAYAGRLIRTAHTNPSSVTVTSDPTGTTYVAGTDYKVTGAGVLILEGGNISDATDVLLSYSYGARDVVQALTASAGEYGINFDGLNEADNGANTTVDLYRVKFGAVESLDMIGDEFVNLALSGQLLLDPTKTGAGESQFFQWLYAGAS